MNSKILMSTALLLLVVGMIQGTWMGATNNMQYLTVHTTVMMPGFVVLATYGTIYRLWPELEGLLLARLQSLLAIVSAVLMIAGSALQLLADSVLVIAIGSFGAIVGAALLFGLFLFRVGATRTS